MPKMQFDYFGQLLTLASCAKRAAGQLVDMLENFTDIALRADQIHATEHSADLVVHSVLGELNRAFFTPIDREDILLLTNHLDDLVDSIEDVAGLFDMLQIGEVRPEASAMAALIVRGCGALYQAVEEFRGFRTSQSLHNFIIQVNQAEEEADRLHRSLIKGLFQTETDPILLMKWKEIYDGMEAVLDHCEEVAYLMDAAVIKNS